MDLKNNWREFLRGARKSWTMISAALLAVVGALQTQVDSLRRIFLDHTEVVLVSLAVVMALLRVRTDKSLLEKGKGQEPPPP